MTHVYYPKGVCSRKMTVDVENGVVNSVAVEGGCSGNLQGICRLVAGMPVDEAVRRMRGIRCGFKNTSCPDQLSIALERAAKVQEKTV